MSNDALALLLKVLTAAPQEVADVKQIVADIKAGKDVVTEVKMVLNDLLKMLSDAGL